MKDTTRINLRMESTLLEQVQEKAKANHLSFNEYIAALCRKALAESNDVDTIPGKRPPARLTVTLSEEERELVRKRTAETGLPPWEIVKKLLCQSCPAIINIEVYDILKLEETIEPFIATIYGIARVVFKSEKAFPADLQKILSATEKIGQALTEVVRLETAGRNQLYEEARKKYFPEIESTKQIRKRLRGDTHGSDENPGNSL